MIAPAIHRFLSLDGVAGHADESGKTESLYSESFVKAFVELHAAAALVRCGDHEGLERAFVHEFLRKLPRRDLAGRHEKTPGKVPVS